jgi:hypothetical protein
MKKLLTKNLLLILLLFPVIGFGQAPEAFKYQAVIRDGGNLILTDQTVGMRLSIQQDSIGGTSVYTETFTSTSNGYGLVNLEIGTGISTDDFAMIDWANGPYFMETAVDLTGGMTYEIMGTSQLMSVPYALYAKTSGNGEGPQGPAGVQGPQGIQGVAGIDGATGPAGANGTDGVDGIDGASEPTYTIGLWPELGGYVFWVSEDGKHGLVAETQDQGIHDWYEAQSLISNPSNHSVNGQKFRDWRMPTKFELNEMYLQKEAIGGFAGGPFPSYWSSAESADYIYLAWAQLFLTGNSYGDDKVNFLYVRAIRAF